MDNNSYRNLQPKLKIGHNCYYMNISGILEYKNALPLALTYTYIDFIYDLKNFLSFKQDDPPEKYISKQNDLIINSDIGSVFSHDYNKNIYNKQIELKAFNLKKIESVDDLSIFKTDYLDKNNPIIFTNDLYYVYDDYVKKTNELLLYHIGRHSATLLDVDIHRRICIVMDKFFSFIGEISIENYIKASTSPYLHEGMGGSYRVVELKNRLDMNDEENIRQCIKKNIEFVLEKEVDISGRHYYKGIKALELFIGDYDLLAEEMIRLKGKYAPQFINNMLQGVANQRLSYYNLMNYLQTIINIERLAELVSALEKLSGLWNVLDPIFDKCYIIGNNLDSYKHKLLGVFNKILEQEKRVSEMLSDMRCKL